MFVQTSLDDIYTRMCSKFRVIQLNTIPREINVREIKSTPTIKIFEIKE